MKNIYLLSTNTPSTTNFLPVLWPSAKTFYELYGDRPKNFNWVLPITEFIQDIETIKKEIRKTPPDIFGVSLYVWNYEKSLALCAWVKSEYPNCLVLTGGPHQYFKHDNDWFKKYQFIDASLPGEVYGEIAIADILNNITDDNTVNWNTVEQIVYPNKNRNMILRSTKSTYRRDFKWNYSAFESQVEHIEEYVRQYALHYTDALFAKIETTRGCPYECTFCDWGGGVGTKVIVKDLEFVKKDIDVAAIKLGLNNIFICDANFGINGDRDVAVIQYLADIKKKTKQLIDVQYGGHAKTKNHFDYLKKMLSIEAENNLSYSYKISQQSFNDEILENVKRTDLRSTEHFELAKYLYERYAFSSVIELIFGLPGTTLETWYNEFNKPYEWGIIIKCYEWYLLPEAESYNQDYRLKHGIQTSKKYTNNSAYNIVTIPNEIVVGGKTFTKDDYKQFITSYALYLLFVQTGIYKKSIKKFLKDNDIQFGDFLRKFYNECYPKIKSVSNESISYYEKQLSNFTDDEENHLTFIHWKNNDGPKINMHVYFIIEYFKNYEIIDPIVSDWFISIGADKKLIESESQFILSEKRMHTAQNYFFSKIKFNMYDNIDDFILIVNQTSVAVNGPGIVDLLIAKKTFRLGI